ncbi:MAG: HEAT repeat domain-containing protein [Verrucomicrobia bacterium]|nr:HEAT repeat domain-containing protein [Verrucomicrobiota bacterium]
MSLISIALLLAVSDTTAFGQAPTPLLTQPPDKLIAILKSDAGHKEKADACRQLAVIGTKEAVAPLASLLEDEKLSHMARYALETIPDPAAAEALRGALGKLKGRPLVGVIGSLGVRRDANAVEALAKFLVNSDAEVAQGAARALGSIGTSAAAKSLDAALAAASAGTQVAFCEGLLRCAEALAARGERDEAIKIYDRLRGLAGPHQVRAGSLRGAILLRQKEGLPLLRQALRSEDFILVGAAARTAMEMPGGEVTQALLTELKPAPANNQILIIQALGKRGDRAATDSLCALAKSGEKSVRLAAIRALAEIGDATAAPILAELEKDADPTISAAAMEGRAALPGQK